jgi:hypothetical protein
MTHIDDPEELSPKQRHQALVAILALGILRLRKRQLGAAENNSQSNEKQPESSSAGLDDS